MNRSVKFLIASGAVLVPFVIGGATSVDAGPPQRESWAFDFQDVGLADYCPADGYEPLTIDRDTHLWGDDMVRILGRDRVEYWSQHGGFTTVRTNPANGNTLTTVGQLFFKDLHIVDNGDGSVTVTLIGSQHDRSFDGNGTIVDQSSNHFEEAFTFDMVSGDELAYELFKSVGHGEDNWCATVHDVLQ